MNEKTNFRLDDRIRPGAGRGGAVSWIWELRSVNGRGLDIKLRLANGLDALELPLRDLAAKQLKRGNVSGTLTLKREAACRADRGSGGAGAGQGPGDRAGG